MLIRRGSKFIVCNYFIFLVIVLSSFAGNINAAGGLDTTFGGGGVAFVRVGTTTIGNDLAIQADGKIVVVGYTPFASGSNTDFALARFNTNGSIDTSFGSGGKVITPIGQELDIAYAVAIQADGKIIAAGGARMGPQNDDFAIVRYNPDGSLDTSFGTGGIVVTQIGGDDFIYSIAIQPDGKINAGGQSGNVFAVARYNTNGSLDTSFDGDGKVTTFLRGLDKISKVLAQPDGKILAAGSSYFGANQDSDFALVRYNSNGSLDTSFDDDGIVITGVSPTNRNDWAAGLALQADGKIVAVGTVNYDLFNDDSVVVRYNPNGLLDTSFDGDGKVFVSFTHLLEAFLDVAVQPDGKIVAAGYKSNNSGSPTINDITVARLNTNGSLDTTLKGNGKLITQIPPYDSRAASLKIQPNGKITVGGSISAGSDAEFMLARFMGDVNTVDFDGDSRTDVSIFRPSNGQWWVSRSSDNSHYVLTFGVSTDKLVPADYTGDGKTDVAIYRPTTGEWFVLRSEDLSFYAFPFGISTDTPVPADYDGDGRADAAVFRASTGTWYVNNSTTGGTLTTNFGTIGDTPVPADYDGDGKADIAIHRKADGILQWWIRRSSNEGVFIVNTTGLRVPLAPGDYTGDGKADFAFIAGEGSFWGMVRSEDHSFYGVFFGLRNDIPTPGDYDGDGKFDLASFRPSDNTWRVLRSTDGVVFQQTFGTTGDLPVPNAFVR